MYNPNRNYPPILKALKKYYGYDSFRPGQVELIHHLLDGHDVLGIMPTGAGKSVCFQIPAIFMPGITLVISPLISLMKDQVASLIQAKIPAAYLNSSLTPDQYRLALRRAKEGCYKIIYVAPERLNTPAFLDFAHSVQISMIAVDEAHCISQWGQNFRPSYLRIPEFAQTLPYRPIFAAFTATATGPVKDDIAKQLNLQNPYTLITGFDRQNLYFEVQHPLDKLDALMDFLEQHRHEAGIVYCLTRKETEEICRALVEQGYRACFYHGGMSDEKRSASQDAFLYDQIDIIVATNAFGMGIDKSNVRYVVHYSIPSSLENYYQEAGRAGRDGGPAHCLLLYKSGDMHINRFLIDKSYEESIRRASEQEDSVQYISACLDQKNRELHLLDTMEMYATTPMCLRSYLLQYFGESSSGKCDHCSNCDATWIKEDISEISQTIYMALNQLPKQYGLSLCVEYLTGVSSSKIKRNQLQELNGFGCLSELDAGLVRLYLESLLIQGYLSKSADLYQVISLTEKFHKAFSEQQTIHVQFKENALHQRNRQSKQHLTSRSSTCESLGSPENQALFDVLKALRLQLARQNKVPPYVIFSDATLMEMAKKRPQTPKEMLKVSGVGNVKIDHYGQDFIMAIQKHVADEKRTQAYQQDTIFSASLDSDLQVSKSASLNPKAYDRMNQSLSPLLKKQTQKEISKLTSNSPLYKKCSPNKGPVQKYNSTPNNGTNPHTKERQYESTAVVYSARNNQTNSK